MQQQLTGCGILALVLVCAKPSMTSTKLVLFRMHEMTRKLQTVLRQFFVRVLHFLSFAPPLSSKVYWRIRDLNLFLFCLLYHIHSHLHFLSKSNKILEVLISLGIKIKMQKLFFFVVCLTGFMFRCTLLLTCGLFYQYIFKWACQNKLHFTFYAK